MQDVFWSVPVQHGPGNNVFINALKGKDIKSMSEADIIEAVYSERGSSRADGKLKYFVKASKSEKWKAGLKDRFAKEKKLALERLEKSK